MVRSNNNGGFAAAAVINIVLVASVFAGVAASLSSMIA